MKAGFILFFAIALITTKLSLSSSVDFFIRILLFLLFGMIIFAAYWGSYEKEKKFGKLDGTLEIDLEGIRINDATFSWKEIANFEFRTFQIADETLWPELFTISKYYGGPAFSQGVDNFIEFKTNGRNVKAFFQLETPTQKVEFMNMMRLLFLNDRIDLSTTYRGLNLEYDGIQELKKEKSKYIEHELSKVTDDANR